MTTPPELVSLPVERLTVGDDIRLDEDLEALTELAQSVKSLGVLQPLVVRPSTDGWEVVAGRRRLAAARIVGLPTVPCVVRDLDDDAAFDSTLAENLHRRQLSWMEVAMAYDRLRGRGMQQREIAVLVGKHESQVCLVLKLLTIPKELQDRVHRREIGYAHALDLARRGAIRTSGGGHGPRGRLTGADAAIATHWRRRHDRLVAGIRAVLAGNASDRWRELLEQILKLDVKPLPDDAPSDVRQRGAA